jgi:hypothetical protein
MKEFLQSLKQGLTFKNPIIAMGTFIGVCLLVSAIFFWAAPMKLSNKTDYNAVISAIKKNCKDSINGLTLSDVEVRQDSTGKYFDCQVARYNVVKDDSTTLHGVTVIKIKKNFWKYRFDGVYSK